MQAYNYLIHPYRDGFFENPTPGEISVMEAHFNYLKTALDLGILLLAGPCLDDTFGLVIFRAENDQSASDFMFNDPAVRNNVMVAELHPMRITLVGQVMKDP